MLVIDKSRRGSKQNTKNHPTSTSLLLENSVVATDVATGDLDSNMDTLLQTPNNQNSRNSFDLNNAVYIVFDLETTGFSKDRNYII